MMNKRINLLGGILLADNQFREGNRLALAWKKKSGIGGCVFCNRTGFDDVLIVQTRTLQMRLCRFCVSEIVDYVGDERIQKLYPPEESRS